MLGQGINLKDYDKFLFLCPDCGGDGEFELLPVAGNETLQTVRTRCKRCGRTSADFYPHKATLLRLANEWAKGTPKPQIDLADDGSPLIVNYGGGVDSTCVMVILVELGIRPDLIIFADTGTERPETYQYIDFFSDWLIGQGFPGITRVAYEPTTAPYTTLEGNCISNFTLPSISFRMKGCTVKWKTEVMDRFLLGVSRGKNKRPGWPPVVESLQRGGKAGRKMVGYDNGDRDSCRSHDITEDENFSFLYPLRQLQLTREDCMVKILRAGLPLPIKSSCWMCASSKDWELEWMAAEHPELLERALRIEDNAREGKHGLGNVNGLWGQDSKKRTGSWRRWCEEEGIIAPGTYTVIMQKAELLRRSRAGKPPLESNLDFRLPIEVQDQLAQAA